MNGLSARNVVILGSTGSIGRQALDVARRLPDRIRVVGLAARSNAGELMRQAQEFGVRHVALLDDTAVRPWASSSAASVCVHTGVAGLAEISALPEADTVLVALAGAAGIRPTHAAIQARKRIALATKEVLVAAGEHTMALARQQNVSIVPVDSEHSAIYQCLLGHEPGEVDRLFLTASGGPFRTSDRSAMAKATPEQALKHPTWNMGGLVTINSATLMNKGLEIIEAFWLFHVPEERIGVLIHPQSIVHSLVRFRDGSTLAQMGLPDMRLPIQYALTFPEHLDGGLPMLDLLEAGALTFEAPDDVRFPALRLAREALRAGGTMPAVMNAANEAAVDLFLKHRIGFLGIMGLVQHVMGEHRPVEATLENVLVADAWARCRAGELAVHYATAP